MTEKEILEEALRFYPPKFESWNADIDVNQSCRTAFIIGFVRCQCKQHPNKIKFCDKVYDILNMRVLPGGLLQYAIEDEPGHIDWVHDGFEFIDGGYGVKE